MKILSVFVDESGDFGPHSKHSPYYIVTMVFHDQSIDLSPQIEKLNNELQNLGYQNHVVHTEPLIRRETDYQNLSPNERRAIFSKLFHFVIKSNITYKSFIFHKKEYENIFKLEAKMAQEISMFLKANLTFFQQFERIILYYDNGQHELNRILNTVFATELTSYEIRKVLPCDYKLFQAADMICTLELMKLKIVSNELTRSEQLIFHSKKQLRKEFL